MDFSTTDSYLNFLVDSATRMLKVSEVTLLSELRVVPKFMKQLVRNFSHFMKLHLKSGL